MSELAQIRPGLWRWALPHPGWRPDAVAESPADWPREVGSVLLEADDATVLIDPLIPDEGGDSLLAGIDATIRERRAPVCVLTTIQFHRRSREMLARRYGASTSRARAGLPGGVEAIPIRGAGETIFWLSAHRALVPGDRIIGAPGGELRLCPESWLAYLPSGMSLPELRNRLRSLLDLPIEMVLVSHGDPVLASGREALAAALD